MPNKHLRPVLHIQAYLHKVWPLRSDLALFITTTDPYDVAAWAMLRQWFTGMLSGAGVDALPGSSQAAVASMAIARGLADNAMMEAVDWASTWTLHVDYSWILLSYALQPDSVQHLLVPDP